MSETHEESTEIFPVLRYTETAQEKLERAVAHEYPLTIVFNNRELATILCTPKQLDHLTLGFLSSEGFLKGKEEIKSLQINEQTGIARLETFEDRDIDQDILYKRVISTGCGRGAAFYNAADLTEREVVADTKILANDIFSLINQFQHASSVYKTTHGVHSAALCLGQQIIVHAEDIGRHNAIDKIFGRCLWEGIPVEGLIILTTGRISSEVIHKAAKKDVPVIISISAPTSLAVRLARKIGITLIASVRGGKMDVYTHDERVLG
ncbi:MAG: formate dehydrogenase accessory sulfurtransferase FdhD [Dehalococcoidia bacterium]|nr:formate dehydrogenase accessory sulfurtransferase FdhD [Dehalococcoidia bacterium]